MNTGGSYFTLPLAVKRMLEECFFFMSNLTTSRFNFFKVYGSIHRRNSFDSREIWTEGNSCSMKHSLTARIKILWYFLKTHQIGNSYHILPQRLLNSVTLENHTLDEVGRDYRGHLVQLNCSSRVTDSGLPSNMIRQLLNIFKDRDSTISLSTQYQCSATLTVFR